MKTGKRCVIFGGAAIADYQRAASFLKEDDHYIFCDSGLKHMAPLGLTPDLIVGDFDSCENPQLPVETIILPTVKDDTDTVYAVKEALHRGFDEFLLLGVVGGRLDHTLGNVSILLMLHKSGKKGIIADDYSEMEIVGAEPVSVDDSYPFFSLINISGTAEGITIKNAKYPLEAASIACDYQYGISNEVLPGKTAKISVQNGELLLVKVQRDAVRRPEE